MSYDLLIKNGRIVDGSGMPSFNGDLEIRKANRARRTWLSSGTQSSGRPRRT